MGIGKKERVMNSKMGTGKEKFLRGGSMQDKEVLVRKEEFQAENFSCTQARNLC